MLWNFRKAIAINTNMSAKWVAIAWMHSKIVIFSHILWPSPLMIDHWMDAILTPVLKLFLWLLIFKIFHLFNEEMRTHLFNLCMRTNEIAWHDSCGLYFARCDPGHHPIIITDEWLKSIIISNDIKILAYSASIL